MFEHINLLVPLEKTKSGKQNMLVVAKYIFVQYIRVLKDHTTFEVVLKFNFTQINQELPLSRKGKMQCNLFCRHFTF